MNKGELLEFLKPFTDEAVILSNGLHINESKYQFGLLDDKDEAAINLITNKQKDIDWAMPKFPDQYIRKG